jgi:hypothetical protein
VTNSEPEPEAVPGEVADEDRTAVIPEPPMAELPVEVVRDPKGYEAWLTNLGKEHETAESTYHEFSISEADSGRTISLRHRQLMAFTAVAAGDSLTQAAMAAGVSRMTLHRWMKHDAHFQAALRRHKEESLSSAREQLNSAVEAAALNLHKAVRQGHLNASINLLRGVGLLSERKGAAAEPSPRAKLSSRAAQALEERLGQLLSALAKEPTVRGALEEQKAPAAVQADATDRAALQPADAAVPA